METGLLGWVGLGMDTAEVAMLGAILLLLFRVHGNIAGLLRVVRRMDRKTPEPKTGAFLTGAKASRLDCSCQGSSGPSAELMVDPGCGTRCAIGDTGAVGADRLRWTVTMLGLNECRWPRFLVENTSGASSEMAHRVGRQDRLGLQRRRTK
jgi:hypothetical protein